MIYAAEILNEEQLNLVAGGTCSETADDTRFLNSLNGSTDRFGAFKCFWSGRPVIKMVEDAWAKLGITADIGTGSKDNSYYYNGKQITQEEARQHAMQVTGHYMRESDWKWLKKPSAQGRRFFHLTNKIFRLTL